MSTKPAHKKPIFYPASYLVMTVTSLLFLWAVTGLGAVLIHYWLLGVSDVLNDVIILWLLATLTVVAPMHLLAYWQVRHINKGLVTTFSLRFAHGLLGAYLFVVVATTIILVTALLAVLLNALLGTGEFDKQLLAATLSLLQAIIWFKYATNHFALIRSNDARPKPYVAIAGSLAAFVLILSLVFPAMAYRGVAHDFVKEGDLTQLSLAIRDYVDTNSTLPANLNELSGLSDETTSRLGDYQYIPQGETKFGIFGYGLCATFDRSKGKGHNTGFGFASHGAGKQCFTRTTIAFDKLRQELSQYGAKVQTGIQNFLLGAKKAFDQEVSGIENFASGQIKLLERDLEGLEGGTTELQKEMERLEANLTGLEGDTGQLTQDFNAVEQFFHDLGCLFGGCKP